MRDLIEFYRTTCRVTQPDSTSSALSHTLVALGKACEYWLNRKDVPFSPHYPPEHFSAAEYYTLLAQAMLALESANMFISCDSLSRVLVEYLLESIEVQSYIVHVHIHDTKELLQEKIHWNNRTLHEHLSEKAWDAFSHDVDHEWWMECRTKMNRDMQTKVFAAGEQFVVVIYDREKMYGESTDHD